MSASPLPALLAALRLAHARARLLRPGQAPRGARLFARAALCGLLVGYGLLAHRLYTLQVLEHPRWRAAAERQHVRLRPEPAERGRLLVHDGGERLVPLAASLVRGSLLVEGRPGRDAVAFVSSLAAACEPDAPLTPAERAFVEDRVRRGRAFYFRRRRLEPETMTRIKAMRFPHVQLEHEPVRAWPFGPLAAQALGLVGQEGRDASGLERVLDAALTGAPGTREVRLDNLRRERVAPGGLHVPARPGLDAVLSLDRSVQAIAEAELAAMAEQSQPQGAACVVVDVRTGDVLALASWPPFDPERPAETLPGIRCRAITDTYEPGSTIKPLFIAAAWELGLGGPDRPIFCPQRLVVPGRKKALEDHHLVGQVLEADVIVQSSNSGAYMITQRLTGEQAQRVGSGFGLGRRSGIDLPGEAAGRADALARRDVTTIGSYAQGYAVSVTPLQMAMAYAALANGGTLYRPRLVRELRDRQGEVVREWAPQAVARPLSGEVARGPLRAALERVVNDPRGTARRAQSDAYRVAGKTGTTKLLVDGRYHDREVVASFCGFAPADEPRIAFSVVVWGPSTARAKAWGGTIAAPVAGRVAEQALRRLRVTPSPRVEVAARPSR
ncbi:MAG: penicillin-binding protein 2 [Planctomycetes bacterium]|nr:penicillin-binding protein 2 [Planctomycetota bacterium]